MLYQLKRTGWEIKNKFRDKEKQISLYILTFIKVCNPILNS